MSQIQEMNGLPIVLSPTVLLENNRQILRTMATLAMTADRMTRGLSRKGQKALGQG